MTFVAHYQNLPVICVLGGWSSGTTAVTGYLARSGAYSCPPHVLTNDDRTPDSHESLEYAKQLRSVIHENSFEEIGDRKAFVSAFTEWIDGQRKKALHSGASHLILKHPLAAFLLKEIHEICEPQILVVTRPFEAIEDTRKRRKWMHSYGAVGAQKVYSTTFSGLIALQVSYQTVAFQDFLRSQTCRMKTVQRLGLSPTETQTEAAEIWIK